MRWHLFRRYQVGECMQIQVKITRERIVDSGLKLGEMEGQTGAWVEFSGLVRCEEAGQSIAALEYEAYDSMAVRTMREILEQLKSQYPCHSAHVIHRVGVVPVGEAAIWIGVSAGHRKEALALVTEFMDRLKQDVPIWKRRALTASELSTAREVPGD